MPQTFFLADITAFRVYQYMIFRLCQNVIITSLLFLYISGGSVLADDYSIPDSLLPAAPAYFGLALPLPVESPEPLIIEAENSFLLQATFIVKMTLDDRGGVAEISADSVSEDYLRPLQKARRQFRFAFLPGEPLTPPVVVPVKVEIVATPGIAKKALFSYPISSQCKSDDSLLSLLFRTNRIVPPSWKPILPIEYFLPRKEAIPRYWIIVARVGIDSLGNLLSLSFPFDSLRQHEHQVHVALINGDYTPLRITGTARATEFMVAFRIFDNLPYPLNLNYLDSLPLLNAPYFFTTLYNHRDLATPALPRTFADGIIESAHNRASSIVTHRIPIMINGEGRIISKSMRGIEEDLAAKIDRLLDFIAWYPARDEWGNSRPFRGIVRIQFTDTHRIVYFPEWLEE